MYVTWRRVEGEKCGGGYTARAHKHDVNMENINLEFGIIANSFDTSYANFVTCQSGQWEDQQVLNWKLFHKLPH